MVAPFVVYFANIIVGFLNLKVLNALLSVCTERKIEWQRYNTCWLITHIVLAVIIFPLVGYHVFVVFSYQ